MGVEGVGDRDGDLIVDLLQSADDAWESGELEGRGQMSIPSKCGDLLSGQLQGGVGSMVVLVVSRTLI
ncbi:hypothetical protein, partial [Streptomyces sp. NPDC059165]|uniref:hypothetical protein n=1 Tax=Streptomyces sp. NPDC059165 TaxID=3346751 RepID=UPI0036832BBA